MNELLYYLVWEWINIALEYTATTWVELPRWFFAVVVVNLLTHPLLMVLLSVFGCSTAFVLPCEVGVVLVEALVLMAIYGFRRWRYLLGVAFLMNAASYVTGLLIF